MERAIDLNSDMGESFGRYTLGMDESLLDHVSSANVACGYHAGDPTVMRRTVELCGAKGVGLGAHPGYLDLVGFGRRELRIAPDQLYAETLYQVGALGAFARAAGVELRHVKAHGALYNVLARDEALAVAFASAVAALNDRLILVGLPGCAMERAAGSAGLRYAREAFADRAYNPDGTLASRARPDALVTDPREVAARVIRMARDGRVTAIDGSDVELTPDTICLHGDTPGAAVLAQAVRGALAETGIAVVPLSTVVRQ